MKEIFKHIWESGLWGGKDTDNRSGQGSTVWQTRVLVAELPKLLGEFEIITMLDIPCGEFKWMSKVDLDEVRYTGADIVEGLIQSNKEKYPGIDFVCMDVVRDPLSRFDLIFCRDCLVHFPHIYVFEAIRNIVLSGSRYLMATTFPGRRNPNLPYIGWWQPYDLEGPPFLFPKPIRVVREHCTQGGGAFRDKSMGLWLVKDIRENVPITF